MVKGSPKRRRRKVFFREWRKFRRLTQKAVAERIEMSGANLSRLETGKQSYTQANLEALAFALDCEPHDLIGRPPTAPPPEGERRELFEVIEGLPKEQLPQAISIIRVLTPGSKSG